MTVANGRPDVELSVTRGPLSLAGSLWIPRGDRPRATVLMWPGSGSSDRNNDEFFPPIREALLLGGVAVASFDKRGVGGSTGDWRDANIVDQADDARAIVDRLIAVEQLEGVPIGLYGHSQGGWVVIEEAAGDDRCGFVISSSGPGVTPGQQERFAILRAAQRDGLPQREIDRLLEEFDGLIRQLRAGAQLADVRRALEAGPDRAPRHQVLARSLVAEDELQWAFMRRSIDHDPRAALERLACPILGLYGGDDRLVPVDESVAIYRAARQGTAGLTIRVFPGADHRCQLGDPPRLAPGYLELLLDWIVGITTEPQRG